MAYEVFPSPVRKGKMSAGVFSIRVGSLSITLNEAASKKFFASDVEVSVICLYDEQAKRAAIRPSTGFENGQFRLTQHPKSKYVRVVGLRPFIERTGMIGPGAMYCKDVRCDWDEPTQTLSWSVAPEPVEVVR